MKAPWFPFYTGDFLASTDVQLMSAAEVGAYCLLLAHSWQSDTPGYLPNDEGRLRRLCRMTPEQWADCKDLLLPKWPVAEDATQRYNPRLLKEAEKQVELREKKAEAGRRSAAKREAAATQGQQAGNTNPTGVDQQATGVAENGNYSQPQSQPQEGKPSVNASLRSASAQGEGRQVEEPSTLDAAATPPPHPPVARPPRSPKSKARCATPITGPLADLLNEGGAAYRVQGLDQPLNDDEAARLVADYGESAVRAILLEMANWRKLLSSATSANLTARTWLNKRRPAPDAQPVTHRNGYNPPSQLGSQMNRRQQAIAGSDARFDALAAGQQPY